MSTMHDQLDYDQLNLEALQQHGFTIVPQAVPEVALLQLESALKAFEQFDSSAQSVRRRASVYAIRNLLQVEAVRELCHSLQMRRLVEPVLGSDCFAVRGILFDKTPGANWKVPYHQDLSIAVRERIEVEGFGPWSQKASVTHVQPPVTVLEQMLSIRLHLDDCGEENGPLRVLPGSHRSGRLDAVSIQNLKNQAAPVKCLAQRGGVLLMRPLLLHASSSSQSLHPRRVVHLEWAASDLPGGPEWFERV